MGEFCVNAPWSYAPCCEFWGLLLAAKRWRLRKMRCESLRLTHENLESQKRVANKETMRGIAWKGDGIVVPQNDQAQLTVQIRDALRSRKING